MTRYSIFKKSNKFYWSNNRVIYSIVFISLGILLFKEKVLNLEKNLLDNILIWLIVSTLVIGLFISFVGFTKPDPLRGKLHGFLIFENDRIIVDEEIILIEEIKKIEITNDDYYGKLKSSYKGNFNSIRSNGVENNLSIFLNSGEIKKVQYELYNSDDLQKIKNELIIYHQKGKLSFINLTEILGIKKYDEIQEFKKMIQ